MTEKTFENRLEQVENSEGINDYYDRINRYRKERREYVRKNLSVFKSQITKKVYPQKCLACYLSGINFCRFWELNFDCKSIDGIKDILERI